ncbi:hypothetical protein GW796_10070 [archaeon]|nr:hypothetical protein [archaeon]
MTQYPALIKIIKKGKKIENPINLGDLLVKFFSDVYTDTISRELYFVGLYYGLVAEAITLENIGSSQPEPLTRERVRQIIDAVLNKIKPYPIVGYDNPFEKTKIIFNEILDDEHFLRIDTLLKNEYFASFKKNVKGLISFLNDCGIRQIAYRKKYYFYPESFVRKDIIQYIQKENKTLRRDKTLENMTHKSKTVTYVPDEVRAHLLSYAEKNKINLNPLYESILNEFMDVKPYNNTDYVFSRTKSWKARKGKAQWQQIGIYIDKNIFDSIKTNVSKIKQELKKNVSLMSFICQSFVWHYEKNQGK